MDEILLYRDDNQFGLLTPAGGITIRSGGKSLHAPTAFSTAWGFFDAVANGETCGVSADHILTQLATDMICAVFIEAYRIEPAYDNGDEALFTTACSFIAQFAYDSTLDAARWP